MQSFNWNDLRFFLELVRTGSASKAGRRLKADHTTVRRRVAVLEDALAARLFVAGDQGQELTHEGEELFKYAESMEALAIQATGRVSRTDLDVSGTVRIGAPDGFGAFFLAPRLQKLFGNNPDLQIELVAMPRVFNLSKREADIAISLSPPTQNRQIIRKLTTTRLHLYASPEYLDTAPPITGIDDLVNHRVITYIPELLYAPELDYASYIDVPITPVLQTTSIFAQLRAALNGIGIAVLPSYVAAGDERLRRVIPEKFSLDREFWLVIHPDMINLARVRTVTDFIVEQVQQQREKFLA